MSPFESIHDVNNVELNVSDLTRMQYGGFLKSSQREIPRSEGLKWWIQVYPAGKSRIAKGYVSVSLWANRPYNAKYTFAVAGSSIDVTDTCRFLRHPPGGVGHPNFASHEKLGPLFVGGKITITCNVEFKVHVRCAPSMPRVYELYRYVPGSYYIHVGSKTLEVHQEVLRKISSYYRSYLVARKNMVIRSEASDLDSDYNAVKATIDFAYGREVKNKSFDGYVSIYRFANRLRLDAVTDELDKYLISNLSIDTVSTVMQCMYAANKKVHPRCIQYFKDHEADIKKTDKFLQLSSNTVIHVLKKAFGLETNADVLRHGVNNGYEFVINEVEQCLLKSLTLAEFCGAVSYAWERDRDDIKQACAKFCNDNLAEVMKLDAFFELPTETIGGVMKLAHDLNREVQ